MNPQSLPDERRVPLFSLPKLRDPATPLTDEERLVELAALEAVQFPTPPWASVASQLIQRYYQSIAVLGSMPTKRRILERTGMASDMSLMRQQVEVSLDWDTHHSSNPGCDPAHHSMGLANRADHSIEPGLATHLSEPPVNLVNLIAQAHFAARARNKFPADTEAIHNQVFADLPAVDRVRIAAKLLTDPNSFAGDVMPLACADEDSETTKRLWANIKDPEDYTPDPCLLPLNTIIDLASPESDPQKVLSEFGLRYLFDHEATKSRLNFFDLGRYLRDYLSAPGHEDVKTAFRAAADDFTQSFDKRLCVTKLVGVLFGMTLLNDPISLRLVQSAKLGRTSNNSEFIARCKHLTNAARKCGPQHAPGINRASRRALMRDEARILLVTSEVSYFEMYSGRSENNEDFQKEVDNRGARTVPLYYPTSPDARVWTEHAWRTEFRKQLKATITSVDHATLYSKLADTAYGPMYTIHTRVAWASDGGATRRVYHVVTKQPRYTNKASPGERPPLERLNLKDFLDVGLDESEYNGYLEELAEQDPLGHSGIKLTSCHRRASMQCFKAVEVLDWIQKTSEAMIAEAGSDVMDPKALDSAHVAHFSMADKNENGKARMIVNTDDLSYLLLEVTCGLYEDVMQSCPWSGHARSQLEGAGTLLAFASSMHRANAYGCSIDWSDYNIHSVPEDQAYAMECIAELVSSNMRDPEQRVLYKAAAAACVYLLRYQYLRLPNTPPIHILPDAQKAVWVEGKPWTLADAKVFCELGFAIRIYQGLSSGLRCTDLFNTLFNRAYCLTILQMLEYIGLPISPGLSKHCGDDATCSFPNLRSAQLMVYGLIACGHDMSPVKQLISRRKLEYLRRFISPYGIAGFIHRAGGNFLIPPLQRSEVTTRALSNQSLYAALQEMFARGLSELAVHPIWRLIIRKNEKAGHASILRKGREMLNTHFHACTMLTKSANGGLGWSIPTISAVTPLKRVPYVPKRYPAPREHQLHSFVGRSNHGTSDLARIAHRRLDQAGLLDTIGLDRISNDMEKIIYQGSTRSNVRAQRFKLQLSNEYWDEFVEYQLQNFPKANAALKLYTNVRVIPHKSDLCTGPIGVIPLEWVGQWARELTQHKFQAQSRSAESGGTDIIEPLHLSIPIHDAHSVLTTLTSACKFSFGVCTTRKANAVQGFIIEGFLDDLVRHLDPIQRMVSSVSTTIAMGVSNYKVPILLKVLRKISSASGVMLDVYSLSRATKDDLIACLVYVIVLNRDADILAELEAVGVAKLFAAFDAVESLRIDQSVGWCTSPAVSAAFYEMLIGYCVEFSVVNGLTAKEIGKMSCSVSRGLALAISCSAHFDAAALN